MIRANYVAGRPHNKQMHADRQNATCFDPLDRYGYLGGG